VTNAAAPRQTESEAHDEQQMLHEHWLKKDLYFAGTGGNVSQTRGLQHSGSHTQCALRGQTWLTGVPTSSQVNIFHCCSLWEQGSVGHDSINQILKKSFIRHTAVCTCTLNAWCATATCRCLRLLLLPLPGIAQGAMLALP
jgi:hypothetical protein